MVTLVVTFLNRPSRLFHSLVEGVAANGAHLIVLGYGTRIADKIKDKLMLQAGLKIVAAHAFFVRFNIAACSKVVIFLDGSDTVLERTTHTAPRAHSGPPSTQWPTERLALRALNWPRLERLGRPRAGTAAARCGGGQPLPCLPPGPAGGQHRAGDFLGLRRREGCLPPSTRKLEHAPARASPAGPPAWTPRPRAA